MSQWYQTQSRGLPSSSFRNDAYERFVLEYAQVDDQIRKLWLQLQQEQHKLLVSLFISVGCANGLTVVAQLLSERKHKSMTDNDREREKGQVKGMAITKKAVEGQY